MCIQERLSKNNVSQINLGYALIPSPIVSNNVNIKPAERVLDTVLQKFFFLTLVTATHLYSDFVLPFQFC